MARKRVIYLPVRDGEWVRPTPQRGYMLSCCDCGLTHRMDFVVKNGAVVFRAFRDRRATAGRRRAKDISMTKKRKI